METIGVPELAARTGIPQQKIHYYISTGFLKIQGIGEGSTRKLEYKVSAEYVDLLKRAQPLVVWGITLPQAIKFVQNIETNLELARIMVEVSQSVLSGAKAENSLPLVLEKMGEILSEDEIEMIQDMLQETEHEEGVPVRRGDVLLNDIYKKLGKHMLLSILYTGK